MPKLAAKQGSKKGTAKAAPAKGPPPAQARPAASKGDQTEAPAYVKCDGKVVPIGSLTRDPMNARLHPDRNLEAIMESLKEFGQRKPVVVREENMTIAAGNGTHEAATKLGWTHIAASIRPMTDKEFLGFALADNRTAELAKWDFEVVARLDKLMAEQGGSTMVGWTDDELEVLRAAEWTPPAIAEGVIVAKNNKIDMTDAQREIFEQAMAKILERNGGLSEVDAARQGLTRGEVVSIICKEWMK